MQLFVYHYSYILIPPTGFYLCTQITSFTYSDSFFYVLRLHLFLGLYFCSCAQIASSVCLFSLHFFAFGQALFLSCCCRRGKTGPYVLLRFKTKSTRVVDGVCLVFPIFYDFTAAKLKALIPQYFFL